MSQEIILFIVISARISNLAPKRTFGFNKRGWISWPAERPSSQKGLCSVGGVSCAYKTHIGNSTLGYRIKIFGRVISWKFVCEEKCPRGLNPRYIFHIELYVDIIVEKLFSRMLTSCRLVDIYKRFEGTSVNIYQTTRGHIP
jgi:hypothetical protein